MKKALSQVHNELGDITADLEKIVHAKSDANRVLRGAVRLVFGNEKDLQRIWSDFRNILWMTQSIIIAQDPLVDENGNPYNIQDGDAVRHEKLISQKDILTKKPLRFSTAQTSVSIKQQISP